MASRSQHGSGPESERVVLGGPRPHYKMRDATASSANLLLALGVAFTLIGLVNLSLLWWPLRFGHVAWEFATFGSTLDNVPMTGLGLGLIAYSILLRRSGGATDRPGGPRVMSTIFGLYALALLVVGVLYLTAVPTILQRATPETMGPLRHQIIASGAEGIIYVIVFGWISLLLWRSVRKAT